jgi:glycosyltransferase involved in cell wall biosynthesis
MVVSLCRSLKMGADVWAAKGAESLSFGPMATVHALFYRRIRLLQQVWLYRRLIAESRPVVVTTARRSDLIALDWVAGRVLPEHRVFLYFHWYRESPRKFRFLQKMAVRQPNLVIFGTTPTVVDLFTRAGFGNARVLPYPASTPIPQSEIVPFSNLLYAGAARQDKGFRQVVDLVGMLADSKETIPVAVQISADHFGKMDSETREDIERLRRIGYGPLRLIEETLTPAEYSALYPGSICLQPYDRDEFRDRVSGVTLDALAAGCPIVTTAGTWMSRLIEPSRAGIALDTPTAGKMYDAAKMIIADYADFQSRAWSAGRAQKQDSWEPLTKLLEESAGSR